MNASVRENPWLVCLLPLAVFMLVGSFEPAPPAIAAKSAAPSWLDLGIEYRHYPIVYAIKIALTIAAMVFVWPGYRKYACRWNWGLPLAVGILGAAAWIALAELQHSLCEHTEINWLKSLGARSAFNPLQELRDQPYLAYGFLVIRFVGLVLIVPVIEEFFLRGCAMRYVISDRFWNVPFGNVNRTAAVAGTLIPVLMHPQEAFAALLWFSAVTWLMVRTRNIWDCVFAHAVTNLLLGIFVFCSGEWWLM
ncbi:MAG TPA: CAAX prenyl protease-related protein [Pirellulales bacterium]|jgi:hypothetical protein